MIRSLLVALPVVLFTLLAACAGDPPIPLTPAPGYPCGTSGVVCRSAVDQPNGFCCTEGHLCGSASGFACHEGDCCQVDGMGKVGVGPPTKQFRAAAP